MPADKDIAEKLEDLGRGTVGTDIFVRFMPDQPDNCIVVTQTAGKPRERTVDLVYPGVQIRVRNTDSATLEALIDTITEDLHGTVNETIEGRVYNWIGATGDPSFISRDEKDREIWSVNFEVIKPKD